MTFCVGLNIRGAFKKTTTNPLNTTWLCCLYQTSCTELEVVWQRGGTHTFTAVPHVQTKASRHALVCTDTYITVRCSSLKMRKLWEVKEGNVYKYRECIFLKGEMKSGWRWVMTEGGKKRRGKEGDSGFVTASCFFLLKFFFHKD